MTDAGLQGFSLRPHHPVRHRSNAYDQEGPDENREWNPSVRRRAVLFDGYVSSPSHFGSAHQDDLIATEPAQLLLRSKKRLDPVLARAGDGGGSYPLARVAEKAACR